MKRMISMLLTLCLMAGSGQPQQEHERASPSYIRINYTVAQFDEFYEAFPSVTEGTPMYVAPEDRILIW